MSSQEEYQRELREREIAQGKLDAIVEAAMTEVARVIGGDKPSVRSHFFFGASAIHPRYLATWFIFKTDADYAAAEASGLTQKIDALIREQLGIKGYPEEGVNLIHASFTTDETIQREAGGNYWEYFK